MSKKNFKAGLESLFSDAMEGSIAKNVSHSMAKRKPKSSKKSFASNLESLFEDAITESTIENANAVKKGQAPKKKTKRGKPVLGGIDSLIRETVETSKVATEAAPSGKKRVTITFDKENLEKLKKIARLQKSYIKDIVNEVVAEYISEFETSQEVVIK